MLGSPAVCDSLPAGLLDPPENGKGLLGCQITSLTSALHIFSRAPPVTSSRWGQGGPARCSSPVTPCSPGCPLKSPCVMQPTLQSLMGIISAAIKLQSMC